MSKDEYIFSYRGKMSPVDPIRPGKLRKIRM
jgi:hypothetical protein